MDKDSLFAIFEEQGMELLDHQEAQQSLHSDSVILLMIINSIESFYLLNMAYSNRFPGLYESVEEQVKFKIYSRIYNYLSKFSFDNPKALSDMTEVIGLHRVNNSFNSLLNYFIKLEEYEKCILVKNIMEKVEICNLTHSIPEKSFQ